MAAPTRLMTTLPGYAGTAESPVASSWRLGFPFRLLLVLCVLPLLLGASALVVYREQQADRVYPGVSVLGVGLGRMSQEQAAQVVKARLQEQGRRPFLLRYDDDAYTTSLGALGLTIDDEQIAQMVADAWQVGRDPEFAPWLRSQLALLRYGVAVNPALGFDREKAVAVLARVAPEVEHPTDNAWLSVEKAGERFEIHTLPARTGRRLNFDATLDRLQQALAGGLPTDIDLVLEEAPPAIKDADLVPATTAIQTLLAAPVVLKDGSRTWRLEPAALFDMLDITGLKEGRPPVEAHVNQDKLRAFVDKSARAADQPAQNPTFAIENSQIVVRKGTAGRLADVDATFQAVADRVFTPEHDIDIVFKEDKPWLTEADLEPSRVQANALLDLPITVETPKLAGIEERSWKLDRAALAQMLVLPGTQAAPRDFATLPAAQRPRFEVQLDSARVTAYLTREVGPAVSEDPTDAALQLRETEVEVPNPAYQAAQAAQPGASPAATSVPPTIKEKRYVVDLRNAKDGRGVDAMATFGAMQVMFRSGLPASPDERKITARLAPRSPRLSDRDVLAARDTANTLISDPVTVRYRDASWQVTRDALAGMLRYRTENGALTAYLTRDGLIAQATAIARDAERRPDAPRDYDGKPLPVDVPNTAGAIWSAALTRGARTAEIVWDDDAIKRADAEAAAATVNDARRREVESAQATATAQAGSSPAGASAPRSP